MDGYVHCQRCQRWHAAGYVCSVAAVQESDAAPSPWYTCVVCRRQIYLDDANVVTPRGRALCLRCGATGRRE